MTAYMDHKNLANEVIDAARAQQIADGVHRVLDTIAEAEAAARRSEGSVRLLAATKTRDVGEIMAAIDAGVRMIGENRPQEITAKGEGLISQCAKRGFELGAGGKAASTAVALEGAGAASLASEAADTAGAAGASTTKSDDTASRLHVPFHLIGQLQANKIGKVLPYVDVIESVDSIESAERIARRALARSITVGVLLEVNESGEASKSGCEPEVAVDLAERIGAMAGLRLDGLMTIGAHVDDEPTIRKGFAHLRATRDEVLASGAEGTAGCRELSMGMTHDMTFAVEEGSTVVRVGTAIFGERAFI